LDNIDPMTSETNAAIACETPDFVGMDLIGLIPAS
jgi:hypothetical protein